MTFKPSLQGVEIICTFFYFTLPEKEKSEIEHPKFEIKKIPIFTHVLLGLLANFNYCYSTHE